MSTPADTRAATAPAVDAPVRALGLAALVLGKATDVLATAHLGPAGELNPAAAYLFDAIGFVPALVGLSVVVVAAVVGVTEVAAWWIEGRTPMGPTLVRLLGYGPLALLWFTVGVYNLVLLGVLA